ncbi:MAG: S1C family serine protease [Solirubrobacterales bacterium]
MRPAALLAAASLMAALVSGCGGDDDNGSEQASTPTTTTEVVVPSSDGDFNPAEIYEQAAPGVVTVLSIFGNASTADLGGAGQGSGFVISGEGEIVTNAHVVTSGGENNGGGNPKPAGQVYVEFSDRNRVPAEIIGFDPDADVALIKVDPGDLNLQPVPLSDRDEFAVGEPVAAIGSPFGEKQSLSVGIISATDRSINSLTQFTVDNAIQTDASINPGNSGGPLIDAGGKVIGINQQIESSTGTNSGVGFAIPVTAIRYSLDQLRESGQVDYAYLGVTTQAIWPQLADEFNLDTDTGALISEVVRDGPADDAGIEGATGQETFQGARIRTGGDVIIAVNRQRLKAESDLAELISRQRPGETVTLLVLRDGEEQEIDVELEPRPEHVSR